MAWVCVGSDFNDSVSDSADFYLTFQITNATTLQKTVEHLGKLQQDRQQLQEEARRLREEVEELNGSIRWPHHAEEHTGVHWPLILGAQMYFKHN